MARVNKGVLYISETDTDIIDMNSGESVFGKAVKYKNSKAVTSAYDEERNRFLISCKDGIYEVDGNNGEYGLLAKDVKFEGKEDPTDMSVRDGGILLTSDQNLTMLDFDGSEKWHVYHRAPGISAVGAVVMGAITAASVTMAAAHGYQAGASRARLGAYHSNTKYHSTQQDNWSELGAASFEELSKRFNATKATENSSFILTKLDDGVGLAKIDKDSGQKVSEVVLNDKKPVYEVDDIEGILYYKSKGNTISAYNLKK
jgi:hypothetical protein